MFGVIGDPHIVDREYVTTQLLRGKVLELNKLDLDFVLVSGDISHRGRLDELQLAKELLDELHSEYYCCHGNHDYTFNGSLDLGQFYKVFGPIQYATRVCGYNLLVLRMMGWKDIPLKMDLKLSSIALIHNTSRTAQNMEFPLFDNPEFAEFLRIHNVVSVFQGHVHAEPKTVSHGGIQYFNASNRLGLGCLESPVSYVPVTDTIENAFDQLIGEEHGENG